MDWYDLDDILYEGTKEEIEKVVCPDCGGALSFTYGGEGTTFTIKCGGCGIIVKNVKSPTPNCVRYFGTKHTLKQNMSVN